MIVGNCEIEARERKRVSRSKSELVTASLHKLRVAKFSEMMKPVLAGKKR